MHVHPLKAIFWKEEWYQISAGNAHNGKIASHFIFKYGKEIGSWHKHRFLQYHKGKSLRGEWEAAILSWSTINYIGMFISDTTNLFVR